MNYNRAQLKQAAKQDLRQADHPRPWQVTLVFFLLTAGLSMVVTLLTSGSGLEQLQLSAYALSILEDNPWEAYNILSSSGVVGTFSTLLLFINILLTLYGWIMSLGYTGYGLSISRGQPAGYRSLFVGFGMAGRTLLLYFLTALFSLLWGMVVFFPGTLIAMILGYALSFGNQPVAVILMILILLVAMVFWLFLTLRYAMAPYLLLDNPGLSPIQAIRQSKELMRGQRGRLFMLQLSFFGWYLLLIAVVLLVTSIGMCITLIPLGAQLMGSTMESGDYYQIFDMMSTIYWGTLLSNLVAYVMTLPIYLWLCPYLSCTQAKFYALLLGESRPVPGDPYRGDDPWSTTGPNL